MPVVVIGPVPTPAGDPVSSIPEDVEFLDAVEGELAEVEWALDRLAAGTYGRCETCGRPLDDAQLEDNPVARYCGDHASAVARGTDAITPNS
jgi:RNA polymerase-binding transcription factor DksA